MPGPRSCDAGQRFLAPNSSWDDIWDAGHYMVVIGLDDRNVYLEDPFLPGSRLAMTREDFVASWHDYESELDSPARCTEVLSSWGFHSRYTANGATGVCGAGRDAGVCATCVDTVGIFFDEIWFSH